MSAPKLRNCGRCGDAFLATPGKSHCPACVRAEEGQFQNVRDYLNHHPSATVKEVSDATEVGASVIMDFLRQGRLDASLAPSDATLTCESCGADIRHGTLCTACQRRAETQLRQTRQPIAPPRAAPPPERGPAQRRADDPGSSAKGPTVRRRIK